MKSRGEFRGRFFTALLLAVLAFTPPTAPAQGCAQCKDNTVATPPATQRAYRHAILLLTLASGGVFIGTLVLLRRNH